MARALSKRLRAAADRCCQVDGEGDNNRGFYPDYGTQEPSLEDSVIPSTKPNAAAELGHKFRIDMSGRFSNPFLSNLLPRTSQVESTSSPIVVGQVWRFSFVHQGLKIAGNM